MTKLLLKWWRSIKAPIVSSLLSIVSLLFDAVALVLLDVELSVMFDPRVKRGVELGGRMDCCVPATGSLYLGTSCIITSLVLRHGSNLHGTSLVSSVQHKQVHGRSDHNTGHSRGALFAGQVGIVSDVATDCTS